jgi:acyl carrier protein
MTSDEALQKVKEIFAKNFGLAPEQILPESKLYEELGLDSLDAVDLVLELQDLTGKKITPDVFKGVRTVADVITIVVALESEPEAGR